ncbi:MAG: hypothetical protein Q7T07_16240 [Burkholderiaceae bacterium]|nr:hypothetical protein [Burkholderiaceae bacterium]
MLAFRVQLNDQEPITGGASDLGVLTATISAVGVLGPTSIRSRDDGVVDIDLRLGGLTSRGSGIQDEHLVWLEAHELKAGDRVVVEIIETEVSNSVLSGHAAEQREDDEKSYYEHCKRAYFEMREKYENNA